jgi:hypothetical protein
MPPWVRTLLLRSGAAVTPLWLDPLAWWLAFSPTRAVSVTGLYLASLELVYTFVLLPALVAFFVCPFCLLFRKYRAGALSWLLCAVVFAAAFFGGLGWRMNIQYTNLIRVTERGEPLIDAIRTYQAEQGRPPAVLDELVPKYIDRVPETGIGAWPEFRYWVGHPERHHGNEWVLVATPPNLPMGFDSLYYHPRQNYSDAGYGPIGTWGYFHD